MKLRVLISLLLFTITASYAQRDLIITQAGEEIRCKILEDQSMKFSFAFINEKGKVVKSEIFKTLISTYELDYYPDDILPNEKLFKPAKGKTKRERREISKNISTPEVPFKDTARLNEPEILVKTEPSTIIVADTLSEANNTPKEEKKKIEALIKEGEDFSKKTDHEIPPSVEIKKAEIIKREEISLKKTEIPDDSLKITKAGNLKIEDGKKEDSNIIEPNRHRSEEIKSEGEIKETHGKEGLTIPNEPKKKEEEVKTISKAATKKVDETTIEEANANEDGIKPTKEKAIRSEFTNYLKYRIGGKIGLANIIEENFDKSPTGLFREKLLRGWTHGLDAAIFLNDYIGLGVNYSNYLSNSSASKVAFSFDSGSESAVFDNVESKVSHKFVGPSLLFRFPLDFKTFLTASASPGYILYTEKGVLQNAGFRTNYLNKGNSLGALGTLGLDFLIGDDHFGRDIILSFECGYLYGQIDQLNHSDGKGYVKLDNPINLNRLEFSIALRFTRFPAYLR